MKSTPTAPPSRLASIEANIARGVRTLIAYHDISRADVAAVLECSTDTLDRRMARGGWQAAEVEVLATYFSVSRNDLLDDTVNPAQSHLDPNGASALSMYLRQAADVRLLAS